MRRVFHAVFLGLATLTICAHAQTGRVQSIGDVTFAVPDGWAYQASNDFGAMAYKEGNSFWFFSVYASMPSSGDPVADFKAAWNRIVLSTGKYKGYPGWGSYSTYEMPRTAGYSGRFNDDASVDKTSYARVYVLETGKSFIPVLSFSGSRDMMDGMNYMELAVVGSIRQAPLKASPIKQTITTADLAGLWVYSVGSMRSYYNAAGQFTGNSVTAGSAKYHISADGTYSYTYGGLQSNRVVNDDDTGVVELSGAFFTFKGRKHVRRYRFVNLQQMLDGSTVLSLWPDKEMSQINPKNDTEYYTRAPRN
jgi:hypothetical protein